MALKAQLTLLDTVEWGPSDEDLPTVMPHDLKEGSFENNRNIMIIDGYVIDVSKFRHPGGEALIKAYYGKDATKAFYGILNYHSASAKEQVKTMRIARLIQVKRKDSGIKDM
jgi:stearoyl-CoA desaturase (Delta-9 desaturase)